jgi:hypothetical protein
MREAVERMADEVVDQLTGSDEDWSCRVHRDVDWTVMMGERYYYCIQGMMVVQVLTVVSFARMHHLGRQRRLRTR